MLDTVRVKFPIAPTEEHLKSWTQKISISPTGQGSSHIYNHIIDEAALRFTYYPMDYTGNPMLTLEVSLPKLLFDNNYQMLSSIDGTIKIANILLDGIPHMPKLDIAEGVLLRLDLCYNHQVGDMVDDYIKALGSLDFPHRRTKHHRSEGTEFRAKHKTTKFYNKERESGFAGAYGILRQEVTLLNPKDIQKLLGKRQPTLMDISKEKVIETLHDDLAKIGLLGNSIFTRDTALKMLCETEGEIAGFYYLGLLTTKMEKSKKEIHAVTGTHPRSLDRKLRKIVQAGIPLTLTNRNEPLPPLVVKL